MLTAEKQLNASRKWMKDNQEAYDEMYRLAKLDAMMNPGSDLRIAKYVEEMRSRGVSVPNAYRAYIARRIESKLISEGHKVRFTKANSKVDYLMGIGIKDK